MSIAGAEVKLERLTLIAVPYELRGWMPRTVIFVAPVLDEYAVRFLRALVGLHDVRVLGVVHRVPPAPLRRLYADLVQTAPPLDAEEICDAVGMLVRKHGKPHRLVGALEAIQVQLAIARDRYRIPGLGEAVSTVFRDKSRMKDALRAAGLPVARHRILVTAADAHDFVADVGLPVVLKPLDGVGAADTVRATTLEEILDVLARRTSPVLAEEMLVGKEHSFEAVTVGGVPRASSFSDYLPACLEVTEKPWIQWACVLPREVETPLHEHVREVGFAALRALGFEDGMTHMEWFEREDGSVVIGEIAQRPPGPQLLQTTGVVHDVDIHRVWARAVVDGVFDGEWTRRWAAGTVFLRGEGSGRVRGVSGVRETNDVVAEWLVEAKLPHVGTAKNPSYEGDGYVVVRHPSTEGVKKLLGTVMQTLRVHYDA